MRNSSRCSMALLIAASGACRRGPGSSQTVYVDPAPVNALVPEKMARLLEFESRDIIGGLYTNVRYTLPVPKSWPGIDLILRPTDKLNNGDSSLLVEPSCDALYCEPEDPNAAIDRQFGIGQLPRTPRDRDAIEIVRDERRDHQRVVVYQYRFDKYGYVEDGRLTSIQVAKWKPGALRYHVCIADLAVELAGAEAAFEKACELMVVHE